jgi:hypothetical protein
VKEVRTAVCRGESHVVDADLTSYFDTIPHPELMKSVARRISDRKMPRLIKMWLKAPVEETDAGGRKTLTGGRGSRAGTPQGGVLSPLLANIYIHRLLKAWKKFDLETKLRARIINYADDLVIVCLCQPKMEPPCSSKRSPGTPEADSLGLVVWGLPRRAPSWLGSPDHDGFTSPSGEDGSADLGGIRRRLSLRR